MANKRTRKQKERDSVRRLGVPGSAGTELFDVSSAVDDAGGDLAVAEISASEASPVSVTAVPAAPVAGSRRRVQRISASLPASPERRAQRGTPAGFIAPLDSDDAAIPFDRVPYVRADLRRVAIIATLMVALIIVADIVVSNVVT